MASPQGPGCRHQARGHTCLSMNRWKPPGPFWQETWGIAGPIGRALGVGVLACRGLGQSLPRALSHLLPLTPQPLTSAGSGHPAPDACRFPCASLPASGAAPGALPAQRAGPSRHRPTARMPRRVLPVDPPAPPARPWAQLPDRCRLRPAQGWISRGYRTSSWLAGPGINPGIWINNASRCM